MGCTLVSKATAAGGREEPECKSQGGVTLGEIVPRFHLSILCCSIFLHLGPVLKKLDGRDIAWKEPTVHNGR